MTPPPVFPTVTKLEAANRQLCAAIRLFFEDADAVAVHTLACAAREIYEIHCVKNNKERMFDVVKQANPNNKEKDLWNILNANRKFFKHPGEILTDTTEFDDSMNDFALLTACTDCTTLCTPHQPPEVQVFALWYLAVESPEESTDATTEDVNAARIIQQQIDATYPGLRTAARAEKKRFGRRLLQDTGRIVQRSEPQPGDVEIAPGVFFGFG